MLKGCPNRHLAGTGPRLRARIGDSPPTAQKLCAFPGTFATASRGSASDGVAPTRAHLHEEQDSFGNPAPRRGSTRRRRGAQQSRACGAACQPVAGDNRRGECCTVILRPRRAERCPGALEDLLGPVAQQVGRLRLDVLGVVAVDLLAACVGELCEQVAVHDRVGPGLVRGAAPDGDVLREVGRPGPQRDRENGCG